MATFNEQLVTKAYARKRAEMIKEMRSIALLLTEEATVLEGTDFHPRAHFTSSVRNLMTMQAQLDALREVFPSVEV